MYALYERFNKKKLCETSVTAYRENRCFLSSDNPFFDSKNNTEKSCLLLDYVIHCLHKIFLYDNQHFLSKERTEALMMPLVDQLENLLGGDEKFHARVSESLIPCIAQFSVAMADDSLWKPLNYRILLKMQHSSPKVRKVFGTKYSRASSLKSVCDTQHCVSPCSFPISASTVTYLLTSA
ncbi:HEAT repeat-containing protein 1-like [Xenopus tropicalis]|uniref:HEAT repeat-containing protein 1 n=1 Tax=Xenopus tropicalis TaxID=8364 RepID=A0A8J1JNF4_XENTR|nr:HEAT repeat-containing protein 1-like [Xenopus tropicalis]